MTITQIVMYIIALFLIALTLFNLFATITAKKRKALSKSDYARKMDEIEKKLLLIQSQRNLDFKGIKRMVNDQDEGIVLVWDDEKKTGAIGMKDDQLVFSYSDICEVKKEYVKQGKKITSAKVKLTIGNEVYTYTFGSKPFSPRGIIGKVVYETTEEFASELERMKKEA